MKLAGKIAIVTGGSRGIGAAIVEKMTREGATVVSFDISGPGARVAAGPALIVDVTKETDVSTGVADVIRQHWRSEVFRQGGTEADRDAIEPAFLHAGFEYPIETP